VKLFLNLLSTLVVMVLVLFAVALLGGVGTVELTIWAVLLVVALTVLALAVVSAGCGTTRGSDAAADAGDRQLRMIIPNSPGGGYDLTAPM